MNVRVTTNIEQTSVCDDASDGFVQHSHSHALRHAGVGADWDGVTMRLPWLYTPTIPLQLFTLHVGAGQNQNQNGCTRRASAQAGARHRLSTSARPRATRAHRPSSCRARQPRHAASGVRTPTTHLPARSVWYCTCTCRRHCRSDVGAPPSPARRQRARRSAGRRSLTPAPLIVACTPFKINSHVGPAAAASARRYDGRTINHDNCGCVFVCLGAPVGLRCHQETQTTICHYDDCSCCCAQRRRRDSTFSRAVARRRDGHRQRRCCF